MRKQSRYEDKASLSRAELLAEAGLQRSLAQLRMDAAGEKKSKLQQQLEICIYTRSSKCEFISATVNENSETIKVYHPEIKRIDDDFKLY